MCFKVITKIPLLCETLYDLYQMYKGGLKFAYIVQKCGLYDIFKLCNEDLERIFGYSCKCSVTSKPRKYDSHFSEILISHFSIAASWRPVLRSSS